MADPARIAVCGFSLESNVFAPPATRADFESTVLLRGKAPGAALDVGGVVDSALRLRALRAPEKGWTRDEVFSRAERNREHDTSRPGTA